MLGHDEVRFVTVLRRHALPFRNQRRRSATDIGVVAKDRIEANTRHVHPVPQSLASSCVSQAVRVSEVRTAACSVSLHVPGARRGEMQQCSSCAFGAPTQITLRSSC